MRNTYSSGLLRGLFLLFILCAGQVLFPLKTIAAIPDGTIVRGERPPIDISTVPDAAIEQGIIRIKFNRTFENILDNGMISSNPDGTVSFGIAGIDQLNQQFGVSEVRKTFDAALQNTKYTERHRQWGFHLWYDLIVPAGTDIRSMVMAYSAKNEIQLSEPVYRKQLIGAEINDIQPPAPAGDNTGLNYVPNDPRYNEQWHYHNTGQQSGTPDADIDLPEAWDITRGNNSVIVAIVDQGIDYTHQDLAANMWPGIGYNFVNNNATIIPGDHGTHVSGTVAGNTNNAIGVSGIAGGSGTGDGIRLMSCQVFIGSSGGSGFGAASIWAADNGAAISQNSWGYSSPGFYEQATLDGIDYFNANGGGSVLSGGITIYAAGNNGTSGLYYPGCYSGCFSVAATGNQDLKAWYSNFDTWVDIAAPGGETNTVVARGVLSSLTGNNYGFYQGTSMACPHVSGVAALILSLVPGLLTPQNVKDILTSTTDNIDALNPSYAGLLGSGRLNAYQALLATESYLVPTANFSASPTTFCSGGSTTFTNLSIGGPTSWNWSFPGGTPSTFSGQNPPAITYPVAGSYSVTLTVSDGILSDTETKTGYINVHNVIADFTGTPLSIVMGGSVSFTDNSGCSPTNWEWSFPGGSPASFSGQNPPAITYATPGIYSVSLVASKPGATDTETKTSYITVSSPAYNMTNGAVTTCNGNFYDSGGPSGNYANNENFTFTFYPGTPGAMVQAAFSAFNVESGYDNLRIYDGINTSAPLIGTYTGTSGPGTITANNVSGALTFNFTSDISVTPAGWAAAISCYIVPLVPVAAFTASSTMPVINNTVDFTDQSSNLPTSWAWSFSPASVVFVNGTSATSQNPQVQFTGLGLYTVTLTATNPMGSDSEIKTDYIYVTAFDYCIPPYTNGTGSGDYISLVQLGSINNATGGASSPFYTYYNSLPTDLSPGTQYSVTLSAGTWSENNNISVWIDFNQNGAFDAVEKLGNVDLLASPATGVITFTVPVNALPGLTRMRVREVWSDGNFDPCGTYNFGETEDYNVNVLPLQYCTPAYFNGTGDGDYISLVQLGGISNSTAGAPSPFYTYFSSLSANLNAGSTHTITLVAGPYPSGNNIAVWIDFDYNGVFDAGEKLGMVSLLAAPASGNITFTVPSGTLPGTTRMRVREVYFDTGFDACSTQYFGETEDYNINILPGNTTLNLTALLEGLYAGGGTMREAYNDLGPHFGPGISDQVTLELHNAGNYGIIEYSDPNVFLNTNGSAVVTIPSGFNGSYYITVKHRNSIETTSALPVSLASPVVNLALNVPANVHGGNLQLMIDGNYVIFGGDTNQDGSVDTGDMTPVDNDAAAFVSGYLPTDVNGDGTVDTGDITIIDNNAASFTGRVTP